MKDTDFLSVSTRVRAMENRLLTRERMERMVDARSDDEAVKVLTECGYDEPETLSVPAVNAVVAKARDELFRDLRSAVPDPSLVDVFQIKYDYHNAKTLIKAEAVGEDAARLLMTGGRYDPAALADGFRRGELGDCSEGFARAVREAKESLAAGNDPQNADLILDRACYQEMAVSAQRSGSAFLKDYVALQVDGVNLRTAVRCARMGASAELLSRSLLPGGHVSTTTLAATRGSELAPLYRSGPLSQAAELGAGLTAPDSGPLTAFERMCDDALVDYLTRARRVPFGVEPVVGYLGAREAEGTAIRTILSGRQAGLPADAIRERLREAYV